jgi:thiamine-phosphate diphosphorylase
MVQVRERGLDDRRLLALTERLVAAAGSSARVVANDRLDVAMAAGAAGVHLRGDSVPVGRARAVAPPGFVIGRSIHTVAEAAAASAAGADYGVAGTIFASRSKPPDATVAGVEFLTRACRGVRIPLLAIGGVTTDNLPAVVGAGAAGIAAIGLFADAFSSDAARMGENLEAIVSSIRHAFAAGRRGDEGTRL